MVRIKWNRRAFQELRREPGVEAELIKHARAIRDRANTGSSGGYVAEPGSGRTRARAAVITGDIKAIRDNAKRNTLLRSLGGS